MTTINQICILPVVVGRRRSRIIGHIRQANKAPSTIMKQWFCCSTRLIERNLSAMVFADFAKIFPTLFATKVYKK